MSWIHGEWPDEIDPAQSATSGRRLNVGCGCFPLPYYTNLDADPGVEADLHTRVPPLPFADGSLDEIFAGHFLEHLTPGEATAFLVECHRTLRVGGLIGIVVPDTREIMRRYIEGARDAVEVPRGVWHACADLDDVCRWVIYSTIQETPHKWCYDLHTLGRLLVVCGFTIRREIDRFRDVRLGRPAWYQCGLDAVKGESRAV